MPQQDCKLKKPGEGERKKEWMEKIQKQIWAASSAAIQISKNPGEGDGVVGYEYGIDDDCIVGIFQKHKQKECERLAEEYDDCKEISSSAKPVKLDKKRKEEDRC